MFSYWSCLVVLACFEIMSLSNSHDTICHRPTSFFSFFSLGDRLFVTWNLEAIDIFSKQAPPFPSLYFLFVLAVGRRTGR